ncbi:hypothetical protein JTB14_026980 [Gonioctena quinquepunctata]|nr:hypothetical protein JTB14_026980 [Gonioctena quinquepunctata]
MREHEVLKNYHIRDLEILRDSENSLDREQENLLETEDSFREFRELGENVNFGKPLPRISVNINGRTLLALIDTRANVNFLICWVIWILMICRTQRRCANATSPGPGHVNLKLDIEDREYAFGATVLEETIRQPVTKASVHEIRVKKEHPFKQFRYGKLSEERKAIVHCEIEKLLEAGVIAPSTSEYCSPVVLVPKEDGKLRFCVDYREINVFSTLDLRKGIWQAPLSKSFRKYTAFGAPDGTVYEFQVLSFRLKNGPAAFQKLMSSVLSGYTDRSCKVYLDDVIIYSDTLEDHLSHLQRVLEILRSHGLRLSPTKCSFGMSELKYLGQIASESVNRPQEEHVVNTIPKSVKQLRGFSGTSPLTDLIDMKKRFKWTIEAEAAFHKMKELVSQPLELARPDPSR